MPNGNQDLAALEQELPPAEETLPPEEGTEELTSTVLSHTVEDIPELANKNIGDQIALAITNISEDGKSYDLEVIADEVTVPEDIPEEISGRQAITNAFV